MRTLRTSSFQNHSDNAYCTFNIIRKLQNTQVNAGSTPRSDVPTTGHTLLGKFTWQSFSVQGAHENEASTNKGCVYGRLLQELL